MSDVVTFSPKGPPAVSLDPSRPCNVEELRRSVEVMFQTLAKINDTIECLTQTAVAFDARLQRIEKVLGSGKTRPAIVNMHGEGIR